MEQTRSSSARAEEAYQLVSALQTQFANELTQAANAFTMPCRFSPIYWLRDGGIHGGGFRLAASDDSPFDRASINVSHVHYEGQNQRPLRSATALSTIVHPKNPHAPSIHMHLSFTELKDGRGTWRIMADLNPSLEDSDGAQTFSATLKGAAGSLYEEGARAGDKYFYIPALNRHRGVSHFYLEGYDSGHFAHDLELGRKIITAAMTAYAALFRNRIAEHPEPSAEALRQQRAYHSLYFLQVVLLDRGTTAGLLVHNQNDIGTLGSLPSHVDKAQLADWQKALPSTQKILMRHLLEVLEDGPKSPIDDATKSVLAEKIRQHYREYPEALEQQAAGDKLPEAVNPHYPS